VLINSALNKDNNKNNSYRYNNKLRKSFEVIKHS